MNILMAVLAVAAAGAVQAEAEGPSYAATVKIDDV